jgi:hypothetical protein
MRPDQPIPPLDPKPVTVTKPPSLIAPFAAALGDRNAEGAMNGHRRLVALFVMLALVGCARG